MCNIFNTKDKKKILIVEDEKILAQALEDKLRILGYKVKITENGKDALKIISQENFNLLILDIIMPKMNGLEFLKRIRLNYSSWTNEVPVIFLTNIGEPLEMMKICEFNSIPKTYKTRSKNLNNKEVMAGYLSLRIQDKNCDYLIKSNCSLEEIVKLIQKRIK